MHSKNIKTILLAAAATVLLAACAHDSSERLGDSVRHMTEQQIQNLDAAYNPDPTPVTGGDVYKLDDVLEAHRNNAEDPTEDHGAVVSAPITN